MHYEINVSKKEKEAGWDGKPSYRHFFATHKRSITDKSHLVRVLKEFKRAFPEPEFNISAYTVQTTSEGIDIPKFGLDEPEIKLKDGYHLFGGKGDVWSNTAHIAKSGHDGQTLCGKPMLSSNHVRNEGVEQPGCKECIDIYLKMEG